MEKSMEKLLIELLSNYFGFHIIQYTLGNSNERLWALRKNSDREIELVFFSNKENIQVNYEGIENYILQNNIANSKLNMVVILHEDSEALDSEALKTYKESIMRSNFNFIIVHKSKQKITYSDEGGLEVANFIHKILEQSKLQEQTNKNNVKPSITYILIVLNLLMFLLTSDLSKSIFDMDTDVLIKMGAKYNKLIVDGEVYRLVTAMFLHGGIMHIAFNMYALYSLGPFIEGSFGKIKYIIIYFVGGILSSIFSFIFSSGVSVGASGAIFALLGAALVFGVKNKKEIGKNFVSNIIQVIVINLFLGLTMRNIDNFGHIGGLVGGIIVTWMIFAIDN